MNRLLDVVVVLDTIAGVLVVLGAAWLVWTRPGLMTWGFFIYVIQFNPGQAFQFWAWLQLWPRALLAQNVIFLVMQAAAYTGLLLFALRAPVDRAEGRWRTIERALPALAIVFLGVALASMATVFGYPAEIWARSMLLIGFAVSVGALAILIGRRRDLSPRDYQRIRWVIWGCLIGLPAYLLAQLSQETSLFGQFLGEAQAPEEVAGALSLVNGILCLFVVEAVRRKSVVNVWIPLRRATAFGLLLSVPVLFLHKQIETIDEYIHMPDWAWVVVASGLVYLIARGHEFATELMDRLFDRKFIRAERHLADVGETIQNSGSLDEIERLLVNEPMQHATPGVGGFVSRAGRLVHPKPQRRLGRGPRRCAHQQPSPALGAVRPKALHPRFGRRRSRLPCRASGRPRAAGSRRASRQCASLLCARPLWRPRDRNRSRLERAPPPRQPRPRRRDRLCSSRKRDASEAHRHPGERAREDTGASLTRTLDDIQACVFDAYGTLFDFASAAARCADVPEDRRAALTALWRDKQLQYAWLRTLENRYADFWQVTGDALDFALESLDLETPSLRERLMDLYLGLEPFPEVPAVLARLREAGFKTAILSNGSPMMLEALVKRSGLEAMFDAVLSVDAVRAFKTHPDVYQYALDSLHLPASAISFQSSNAWDAHGASDFGMRVVWCNRYGQRRERLPGSPDFEIRTLAELPALLGGGPS